MRYLCLDTGGTSIKYAVCDESGQIERTGKTGVGKTLEEFLDYAESIYREAAPVDGIACSFPGEVHSREGVIYGISAVEQLHRKPLKRLLSERCDNLRVTMLNDANAAALGELWLGVGREYKNMAFVIVGSGVGGAVIENGTLYPGITYNRAEFGNFLMGGIQDGKLMSWSDFTLEKESRRYSRDHGRKVNGKELLDMARSGDQEASNYVEEFLLYMAMGCVDVEFAFDPEVIVIGGGISGDARLIEDINRTYRSLVSGQRMDYMIPKIVACRQTNNANLLGALYYYLKTDNQSPCFSFAENQATGTEGVW